MQAENNGTVQCTSMLSFLFVYCICCCVLKPAFFFTTTNAHTGNNKRTSQQTNQSINLADQYSRKGDNHPSRIYRKVEKVLLQQRYVSINNNNNNRKKKEEQQESFHLPFGQLFVLKTLQRVQTVLVRYIQYATSNEKV